MHDNTFMNMITAYKKSVLFFLLLNPGYLNGLLMNLKVRQNYAICQVLTL